MKIYLPFCMIVLSLSPVSTHAWGVTFGKVADTGTQVPNKALGITYSRFGIPNLHNGTAVYRANYVGGHGGGLQFDRVDKAMSGGNITQVMDAKDPQQNPQVGDSFGAASDPSIHNGMVGFTGSTVGIHSRLWRSNQYGVQIVGTAGSGPAANVHNGKIMGDKRIQFQSNIWQEGQGIVVPHRAVIPGGNGVEFGSFIDYLDHNQHGAAFVGTWDNSSYDFGIYRWDQTSNAVVAVADQNITIPTQTGNFDTPYGFWTTHGLDGAGDAQVTARPSVAGNTVAFSYNDYNQAGAYRFSNGSLQVIADKTTPHSSLPGTFENFWGVSTIGSSSAFVASGFVQDDAMNLVEQKGLHLQRCGKMHEVIRAGQILDGKQVVDIRLGHRGLARDPQTFGIEVAFWTGFADGSEGIFTATQPGVCVAPQFLASFDDGTDDGPIGAETFTVPVIDGATAFDATVSLSTNSGGSAVFSADLPNGVYGVDSLPGNDPALIDYVLQAGMVVAEQFEISFARPVRLDGLELDQFGANDSVELSVNGASLEVDPVGVIDGHVELPGIELAAGDRLMIAWDALNAGGDGFSLAGIHITPAAIIPGDFDYDDDVDGDDFLIWQANFGSFPDGGATLFEGDADFDGDVDGDDFLDWQANLSRPSPGTPGAAAVATPEPAALLLMVITGAVVLSRRRAGVA